MLLLEHCNGFLAVAWLERVGLQASMGLIMLFGEIPSPVSVGEGCRFAGRCPKVMDVCRSTTPKLIPLKDLANREVACHLFSAPVY